MSHVARMWPSYFMRWVARVAAEDCAAIAGAFLLRLTVPAFWTVDTAHSGFKHSSPSYHEVHDPAGLPLGSYLLGRPGSWRSAWGGCAQRRRPSARSS